MSAEDRVRWDAVYREKVEDPLPPPDPLLLAHTPPADPQAEPPPRALDLAAGRGQNGLWLAQQGYTVDLIDISRVALMRARDAMNERGLHRVNLLQMDVDTLTLEPDHYDLVCVFRYLRRDLFPMLRASVKPGGRVIYETFNLSYLDRVPGFNVDFLVQGEELRDAFTGWRLLLHEHVGYVTRLVAARMAGHEA